MTGREFSEVDIDLLADYVGGALDGTPDEAVVSALVADDETWRAALEALTAGMTAVGADLRAMGAEPMPMPDDVVARLTAALPEHPAAPPLRVVPDLDSTTAGSATSGTRRRRLARRWAAPVAAAASVLAFAGFGVQQLWGAGTGSSQSDEAASTAGLEENAPMLASDAPGQERAAAAGVLAVVPPPERITTSGIDYDRATLAGPETFLDPASPPPPTATDSRAPGRPDAADVDKRQLPGPDALQSCLEAIALELGSGPIAVDTVDYAQFGGAPALIVRFTVGTSGWVWASGSECGSPPADADTRYRVKVG